MLRLVARYDRRQTSFALPRVESRLGADPGCEIHLPFPGVSRCHARVIPESGSVRIIDLESKNGLTCAGRRITEILLVPGEHIRVGRATLTLEEVSTGDTVLAAELSRTVQPAKTPSETGPATPDLHSEAAAMREALALVRDLERGERADRILERLRVLLGATSIGLVHYPAKSSEEPGFDQLIGDPPNAEELAEVSPERTERAEWRPGKLRNWLSWWPPLAQRAAFAAFPLEFPVATAWQVDLFEHIVDALERRRQPSRWSRQNRSAAPLVFPEEFVAGKSHAMRKLLAVLEPTAGSSLDVLILGETGTGKELIARIVHDSGPTAAGPFVAINCAAIPTDLLEAELFGVEARVATGVDPRPGLFVRADGGSLFLDEIGDMPDPLQAKLLRALQEREVLPLGGSKPRKVRLRVISASNKPIGELDRQGRFRADLYYRLRGLQFHVPPLRERPEDIPELAVAFVQRAADTYRKEIRGITRKALALLQAHYWPGNIRELKSELERAVLLAPDGAAVDSSHLGPVRWQVEQSRETSGAQPREASLPGTRLETDPVALPKLRERVAEVERRAIQEALQHTDGNQTEAAKLLGITRNGLALMAKRLGLTARRRPT